MTPSFPARSFFEHCMARGFGVGRCGGEQHAREQLFLALIGTRSRRRRFIFVFFSLQMETTCEHSAQAALSKKMLLKLDSGKLDFNPSRAMEELRTLVVSLGFPDVTAHPTSSLWHNISTSRKQVSCAEHLRVASHDGTVGIRLMLNLPKTLLACHH